MAPSGSGRIGVVYAANVDLGCRVAYARSKEIPVTVQQSRLQLLIDEHFSFVWRLVRRLGLSGADTDDVVQEVFLVLTRRLEQVELHSERSFLVGTALRIVSSWRRKGRRRPEDVVPSLDACVAAGLDPEELSVLQSARPLLQEALGALPLEMRSVFVLYELEELPVATIAELLGIPRGTTTWRLMRAREEFAKIAKRLQARETFAGALPYKEVPRTR